MLRVRSNSVDGIGACGDLLSTFVDSIVVQILQPVQPIPMPSPDDRAGIALFSKSVVAHSCTALKKL